MKRSILFFLLLSTIVVACNSPQTRLGSEELAVAQNELNISVASIEIDGMTCEMGCAKFIESKLNGLEGVQQAEVRFKENLAEVKFASSVISANELTAEINKMADSRYSVKEIHVEESTMGSSEGEGVVSERKQLKKVEENQGISFPNIFDAFVRYYAR